MEEKIDLILSEIRGMDRRLSNVENGQAQFKVQLGDVENKLTSRIDSIESKLTGRIDDLGKEVKDFRTETKTSLQIIHSGQQGTRQELTQRFKEVNRRLSNLESDVVTTYQKTAQHDLEINRIKKQ